MFVRNWLSKAKILNTLNSVKNACFRKVQETSAWQKSFKEVEREITRFYRTFCGHEGDDRKKENTHLLDQDPQDIALSCKTKLAKTKENLNLKLRSVTDTTRCVK